MRDLDAEVQRICVYCLGNRVMGANQVLVRGESSYICAPRGQLIEGYLVIASCECVGAVALLDESARVEVKTFRDLIAEFYDEVYGVAKPLFYEQGRGGGGGRFDRAHRFPYHAHFCGLPVAVDAHSVLGARFVGKPIATLRELGNVAAGVPYVYVDGVSRVGEPGRIAYLPETPEDVAELEGLRLKPVLAGLLGIAERADWRVYPGDDELARVIKKFGRFSRERGGPLG